MDQSRKPTEDHADPLSREEGVVEDDSTRERVNRRAAEHAEHRRRTDPRMINNPYGPFVHRLKELMDAGMVPELAETLRDDLLELSQEYRDRLASPPVRDEVFEISTRAVTMIALDGAQASLRAIDIMLNA
jgi:hypothetical protein